MNSTIKHQVKHLLVGIMIATTLVLGLAPVSLAEGKAERADRLALQSQSGTGAIAGVVYNDWNQNSERDDNEPTLAGAVLTLSDLRGDVVAQVTTGEDGAYRFDGLRAGGYILMNQSAQGYSPVGDGKLSVIVRADVVAETSFGDVLLLLWGEDQSPATHDQVLAVERAAR